MIMDSRASKECWGSTVYERWKLVLDLIIKDKRGNWLIKTKRIKLYQEPSPEAKYIDKENTHHVVDNDILMPEDIDCSDQGLD